MQHFPQALHKGYAQERVSNNPGLALAKLGDIQRRSGPSGSGMSVFLRLDIGT
jgi:ABC-type histidine transport system ATPase subunit